MFNCLDRPSRQFFFQRFCSHWSNSLGFCFCVFLLHALFQWEFFLQCCWPTWTAGNRFVFEIIMFLSPRMLTCKVHTNQYYLRLDWIMSLWFDKCAHFMFSPFFVSTYLPKLQIRLIKIMYYLWVFSVSEFRLHEMFWICLLMFAIYTIECTFLFFIYLSFF